MPWTESDSDSDCSSDSATLPLSSDSPTLPVSSDRSYTKIYVQAIAAVSLKIAVLRDEVEKNEFQLNLIEQEYLVAHKKAQRRTHSMNLRASTDTQRQQRRNPRTQRQMLNRLITAMY